MSLITYLTRIHFAERVLEDALEPELGRLRIRRPLIVTDLPPVAEGGRGARLAAALPAGLAPSVLQAETGPVRQGALAGAVAAFAERGSDGVIGYGGPGAIDLAKLVALAGGEVAVIARALDGALPPRPAAPLVAVPTSAAGGAGLGTLVAVVRADGTRRSIAGAALLPSVALLDPTLTLEEGPEATAAAGMDALTHCIETYLGTAFNPPADGIALEGLRRAAGHLEQAVAEGGNRRARREMLAAALNGALAEQKGLGGVHALAHALEGRLAGVGPGGHGHGRLTAALLPPVLAFNAPAVGLRFRAIKAAMGLPARVDLGDAIDALAGRVGLPRRLSNLGLLRSALVPVAEQAEADLANRTNPRLAQADDYRAMLEAAL